jgi:hypothetical protein
MTDEEITQFSDSLQSKLGEESMATIADDIGTLITKNAEAQKAQSDLQGEVERLKSLNEKLVITNGNLLKQVPTEHRVEKKENTSKDDSESVTHINLADAFDRHGNFKK